MRELVDATMTLLRVVNEAIRSLSSQEDLERINIADLNAILHAAESCEFAAQVLRRLEKTLSMLPKFAKKEGLS